MIERLDEDGDPIESLRVGPRGEACLALPADDRYTVYYLRTRRGDDRRPAMEVHLRGGANARVLGIVRVR